jgi:hypothetical protein
MVISQIRKENYRVKGYQFVYIECHFTRRKHRCVCTKIVTDSLCTNPREKPLFKHHKAFCHSQNNWSNGKMAALIYSVGCEEWRRV